jgi:energy-coupling factor transport system ATP-binding protein
VVLLGDGELIADGPAAEILSGGWYFATEAARITGEATISPEAGAELLRARVRQVPEAPR